MTEYKYLTKVNSPEDLKRLSGEETIEYCKEAREFIVEKVLENGGHLASNLGSIELIAAIHRVFDLPQDKVVFDVGHQSYLHKMITGRRDDFDTLRKPGGLSGFETRKEGEYDFFGTGHASTSLSAALGFAAACKMDGRDNYAVAVVGDGAFTGGMIHEALNNCSPDLKLIIILNENEMSISKNIGGFAEYIARIRSSKRYYNFKRRTRNVISKIPLVGKGLVEFIRKRKKSIKNILFSSNFFEDMGIFYLGPCDGNDLYRTERLLREAKNSGRCTILHLKTKKGLGYTPAEQNPDKYHGVSPKGSEKCPTFSEEFGRLIAKMGDEDRNICAVTAAMEGGTGLGEFAKRHSERFFDVGIAEEHAATFCAGLCASGKKPVFAVYSTFLQRCYDNLIHDVSLQSLPVVFAIDRAGLAEADGPTHHGIFDVSMVMSIPGTVLYAPLDFQGLEKCLVSAFACSKPSFVRYKSGGQTVIPAPLYSPIIDGKEHGFIRSTRCEKCKNAVITYGKLAREGYLAVEKARQVGVDVSLIILEQLKGDDGLADAVASMISAGEGKVIFAEEGIRNGGAGEYFISRISKVPRLENKTMEVMAIDSFAYSKKGESIFQTCGISCDDIYDHLIK